MTDPDRDHKPTSDEDPFPSPAVLRWKWMQDRREKAVQEILANRRGEYRVPTWVLAAVLVLMIAVCLAVLVFY
jgi:hypothetical protein